MMLVFASSANAAWTYEQTFNTLNNGDLNGQDSWSGAVEYDIQSSISHEGTKAVKVKTLLWFNTLEPFLLKYENVHNIQSSASDSYGS
ncbi:MAG: hypothetical protein UX33_C0041G0011, partial [Candidatus Azambacteria bacterium GW2011_GWC1_46_13]